MYKKGKPPVEKSGGNRKTVVDGVVDGNHHTTDTSQMQGPVESVLKSLNAVSEQTKAPPQTILRVLGMADDKDGIRKLQKLVRDEREHCPIVTGGKGAGFWVCDPKTPQGRADLARCIATYARRGGNTMVTVSRLKRFYKPLPGQIGVDDGEV